MCSSSAGSASSGFSARMTRSACLPAVILRTTSSMFPHVAHRRGMQRERVEAPPDGQEVPVRVDEAGQQRPLAELDDARGLAPQGQHLVARPGRRDGLAPDHHRLDGRLRRVHRDDVVAEEHGLRHGAVALRLPGARAAGGAGACRAQKDDSRPRGRLHGVAVVHLHSRSFSSKNASTRCSYCVGRTSDTRSWRAPETIQRS